MRPAVVKFVKPLRKSDFKMNTYEVLKQAQNDAKYLNRLNREKFALLLFPGSLDHYVNPKWDLFSKDKLEFMWSCSYDKLQLLADYIDTCKGE